MPSGVLHAGKVCVIGNGVVVDPVALLEEIDALRARGYLQDDEPAEDQRPRPPDHAVPPRHRSGARAAARRGPHRHHRPRHRSDLRGQDGAHRPALRRLPRRRRRSPTRCAPTLEEKNAYLRTMLGEQALDFDAHLRPVLPAARAAGAATSSTPASILDRALAAGRRVLFEGAQGTMLDVDHGTYPYVTSSNTVAGAACTGGGIAPNRISSVVGITKAYTTRVGSGPFPDRAARRPRPEAAARRRGVRRHHRPAAALRLVRRRRRAPRRPPQRPERPGGHQARRAHRPQDGARLRRPTSSTAAASTRCRRASPPSTPCARSTRSSPAGTSRCRKRALARRPAGQRAPLPDRARGAHRHADLHGVGRRPPAGHHHPDATRSTASCERAALAVRSAARKRRSFGATRQRG